MGLFGYATGGASGLGPSRAYLSLPFANWRSVSTWLEEFVDAMGVEFDLRNLLYIGSAANGATPGRANLLDPTYVQPQPADPNFGYATTAPTLAAVQDTMLDVLCYVAGIPYPVDTNLTIAQRQALVQVGWTALRRKGTRSKILQLASQVTAGVMVGWTNPPFTFSIILPDGSPSPGSGSWVSTTGIKAGTVTVTNGSASVVGSGTTFLTDFAASMRFSIDNSTFYWVSSVTDNTHLTLTVVYAGSSGGGNSYYGQVSESSRPWILQTERNLTQRISPAWSVQGIGYSQFRAGYSAAGETVFNAGARINNLKDEHFQAWSGTPPQPSTWIVGGTGTITQNLATVGLDPEFAQCCLTFDQTSAAIGVTSTISQSTKVNNQVTHRLEVDYAYAPTGAPQVGTLQVQVTDQSQSPVHYYNPTTKSWSPASYVSVAPVSSSSTSRTRYGFDVVPQADSATSATNGTASIYVLLRVVSDGTATTQQKYNIYRCGLYEKFDPVIEAAASGERLLWLPIKDAAGWTTMAKGTSSPQLAVNLIEPAIGDRSSYKYAAESSPVFPYHPGASSRGYQSSSIWTNLLKGSNDFISDWTASNATTTANSVISPLVGETVASATKVTASTTFGSVLQSAGVTPTNKTYVGGVWAKKVTADATQAGTATFTAGSTTVTGVSTTFPTDGSWNGIQIRTAGGNTWKVASVSSATSLTLSTAPTITESGVTFTVSDIALLLSSTSTKVFPFFLKQAQGWQLLPFNGTFGAGDVATLQFQIVAGPASSTAQFALASSYLYDVTANTGVLYPPVCQTPVGFVADVPSTTMNAVTATQGTNVLHPLLQRTMVSVVSGSIVMTIVPVFDSSGTVPNQVIFDTAQNATTNRLLLQTSGNTLQFKRWDNASLNHSASITLSPNSAPGAGAMTWVRDAPITVRLRWDSATTSLSAGNGYASSAVNTNWSASDATVAIIAVGCDRSGANQFDGLVYGIESLQMGSPVT